MRAFLTLLSLCALLLTVGATVSARPASVDVEQGMIDAIQIYSTALYKQDAAQAASITCQADAAGMEKAIDPANFGFTTDFSGNYEMGTLVLTVEKQVGDVALVAVVSGKGKMNTIILGTPQPLDILPPLTNNRVVLKKEDGRWKVCPSAVSVLNAAPAESSGMDGVWLIRVGLFGVSALIMAGAGFRLVRSAGIQQSVTLSRSNMRIVGSILIVLGLLGTVIAVLVLAQAAAT